ncbi:hypothetical protein PGT21_009753 [Puccinia graminis f. sp. tritici]|uniref:Uncharacterized protein n=2 Tax=Puccinia graminis f. sp. tritici TaxID=56615 RepID=E3KI91_PUCGT|nr:uncharacterized protein PGTG_09729 [Puccinia graminis f. sp. tritici CRL 75-36-700-3]EFP84016.2 hypothetical protein PGTG_09729 [Puccinia graminis f. sp. tritici CRL 75-36-700-3]KAA1064621.1 hypothetical protein PGT21_009753 [Puccinia graminis f. sp. tritici]
MRFPSLAMMGWMALACGLVIAHKHSEKKTKVVFSCLDDPDEDSQYSQAACGRAIELEDSQNPSSSPTKYSFVKANQVRKSKTEYNCIDTNMDNNYCCFADTFKFKNKSVDVDAQTVEENCIVVPGNTDSKPNA